MKCGNCFREAIYDDGLCAACHDQREASEGAATSPAGDVKVLSQEEKRNFSGVTIDEESSTENNQDTFEEFKRSSGIHIKMFSWQAVSLWKKLLIGAMILLILGALVFVGSFFIMAFFAVAIFAGVISLLRSLF